MNYATQLQLLTDAIITGEHGAMVASIYPARHDVLPPATRLAVYAGGYGERLLNAVLADYPTLALYAGEEALKQYIRTYIQATPSCTWDLNRYPFGFGSYFAQRIRDKGAGALALLESAIAEVFWMPESDALEATTLAVLPEDQLDRYRFTPRMALKLLSLEAAANTYLQDVRDKKAPGAIRATPEYLAVVRHDRDVRRVPLGAAEYALLMLLAGGLPFGKALEQVGNEALAADLPQYLASWLAHGFFTLTHRPAAG